LGLLDGPVHVGPQESETVALTQGLGGMVSGHTLVASPLEDGTTPVVEGTVGMGNAKCLIAQQQNARRLKSSQIRCKNDQKVL
jgi:hypothetical protein